MVYRVPIQVMKGGAPGVGEVAGGAGEISGATAVSVLGSVPAVPRIREEISPGVNSPWAATIRGRRRASVLRARCRRFSDGNSSICTAVRNRHLHVGPKDRLISSSNRKSPVKPPRKIPTAISPPLHRAGWVLGAAITVRIKKMNARKPRMMVHH